MSDPLMQRRDNSPPPVGSLFALVDPPRETAKQKTRWNTQDEAYLAHDDSQVGRIYREIQNAPATCDEIELRLGMTHQSASAAINLLMNNGMIVANGTRKTRSGRNARVWEIRNGNC